MIKRKKFDDLMSQKDSKKVSLVIGPRQVGKTTLLKSVYDRIKTKAVFLDLDVFSNFERVSTYENLLNFLRLNGYREDQRDFFYLSLDEFQRYGDLSRIMKNVFDNHDNIKIYASGSSSLKNDIQESLAGRKIISHLYPLDFEEFLWFKGKEMPPIDELEGEGLENNTVELLNLLDEFLVYGGYPEVVLSENKKEVFAGIFDLYVKKDLVEYLKIDKVIGVKNLIEHLAINNGQKLNYEKISDVTLLDNRSARDYIEKETFLICLARPFFTNKNKEIVKMPKAYFLDNGVRNYFVNNFNNTNLREDAGFLFEGFVVSELIKSGIDPTYIKFWKTKSQSEVDIVVDLVSEQVPIEVKFKNKPKTRDFSGVNAFLSNYPNVKRSYVVNKGIQKQIGKVGMTLPYNFGKRFK